MDQKKSAPVWGLFYRELYPLKKELALCYIIGIVFSFVCWLVKLSMEIGNLANMPAETIDSLKATLPGYAIYFPGILYMAEVNGSLNSLQYEMTPKFRCFTASLPVNEWKLVGVKYLSSAVILVIGTIAAMINAAVMCSVFDTPFNKEIIATLLFFTVGVSLLGMLLYTLNYLFRNSMAAVIVALFFFYPAFAIIMVIYGPEDESILGMMKIMDKFSDFTVSFLPFSIPSTILLLVLGWVFCSLLAKRREK